MIADRKPILSMFRVMAFACVMLAGMPNELKSPNNQKVTSAMSFNKEQFQDLIDRVLKAVDLHSEAAVDLLLKTAAHESKFGTYLKQIGGGPALGIFQVEPDTEKDIWLNYLRFNLDLTEKIKKLTGIDGPNLSALEGDLRYQVIMARLVYRRVRFTLPDPGDVLEQAKYWKKHYNTMLGAGTVEDFIKAAEKYVGV